MHRLFPLLDSSSIRRIFSSLLVLLVSVVALIGPSACAETGLTSRSVPLNSSVLLLDRRLLEKGPELVRRIAKLGDRRLMLVVTMQCRLNEAFQPIELGLMTDRSKSWEDLSNFEPLDDQILADFRQLLAATLSEAVEHKMEISLVLHYDPAGTISEWRNFYDFDPCEPVITESATPETSQSYSFETAVVDSVVVAIKKVVPTGSPIHLSLAGEMGKSIFAYPNSYEQIGQRVRKELADYSLEIGVSLNHNKLAGGLLLDDVQRAKAHQLFASLDFVGYSHYRPLGVPIDRHRFQEVSEDFLRLLAELEVTIPREMPLHLSEVAIGGAPNKHGVAFPDWAVAAPQEGTNDPKRNPWRTEQMVELRRTYHDALLDYLSDQTPPNRVTSAFLWSEGSWDPMGISSSTFVDPVIQKRVVEHNARSHAAE